VPAVTPVWGRRSCAGPRQPGQPQQPKKTLLGFSTTKPRAIFLSEHQSRKKKRKDGPRPFLTSLPTEKEENGIFVFSISVQLALETSERDKDNEPAGN
jgi:hypothetical protein